MARAAILVIGDTQYLFDGRRMRPELLAQTFGRARDLAEECLAGADPPRGSRRRCHRARGQGRMRGRR